MEIRYYKITVCYSKSGTIDHYNLSQIGILNRVELETITEPYFIVDSFRYSISKYLGNHLIINNITDVLEMMYQYVQTYAETLYIDTISWNVKLYDGFDGKMLILGRSSTGSYTGEELVTETSIFPIQLYNIQ